MLFRSEWLQDPWYRHVWWNYKEDAKVIEDWCGLELDHNFWADAMIMDGIVDETDLLHGLKHAGAKWLNWRRSEYKQTFCYVPDGKKKAIVIDPHTLWHGPLPEEMIAEMSHEDWKELFRHYAADDAEETWALYVHHRKKLRKMKYWKSYLKYDRDYTKTLRACERRGVPIDMDLLKVIERDVSVEMLRLATAFKEDAGLPVEFNVQSNQQLQHLFFQKFEWPEFSDLRTNTDAPQLNDRAYKRYWNDYGFKLAHYMLDYNKLKTKKGTFLKGMRTGVQFGDGAKDNLLFTNFNQLGTRYGRISSRKYEVMVEEEKHYKTRPSKTIIAKVKAGMNLQNIPNIYKDSYKIRRVFVAPPGWRIIVADYSGFELWMALYNCHKLGIESKMLACLMRGDDVHSMTAVAVCGLKCQIGRAHV